MKIKHGLLVVTFAISAVLAGTGQADSPVIRLGRDVVPVVPHAGTYGHPPQQIVRQGAIQSPRQSGSYAYRPVAPRQPGVIEESARFITDSAIRTARYEIQREVTGAIREQIRRISF